MALAALAALAAVALAMLWIWQRPATPPSPADAPTASAASAAATPAPLSASQVERGIEHARQDLQRDPRDAAAWAMLAHAEEMRGRFDEAAKAYQQLLALRPGDAQAHADAADALGVVQKGSLQGEPARLIKRALELDPKNLKALILGGKEAFERRRYAEAETLWKRALATTDDVAVRRAVETSVAEARAFLAQASPGASPASDAAGLAFVAGRVSLAPALAARVAPDDTVFIYARPLQGSRMPLALLRRAARELPLDFALDDTLAMVPQARLSQQREVFVGVRVSRRGDTIPTRGDLEGEIGPVAVGSTGLKLEIARERP
jgi:cytochrome c-type biogenesis protein CcmH